MSRAGPGDEHEHEHEHEHVARSREVEDVHVRVHESGFRLATSVRSEGGGTEALSSFRPMRRHLLRQRQRYQGVIVNAHVHVLALE